MRSVWKMFAIAAVMGCAWVTTGMAEHRAGTGLELDAALGDTDGAFGVYAFYEYDLPDPISVQAEISYVGGDFDVESGSGSYSILGFGLAVLLNKSFGTWTGYVGAGGASNYNSFDNVNYDDKLSIYWLGGARTEIADRISLDLSLRYRTLRIDSIETDVEPNPLNADAMVFRAGIVYEL